MYTLKLLAPVIVSLCANNMTNGQGEICNLEQNRPNVVKYYNKEMSCYVNGVFYSRCGDYN